MKSTYQATALAALLALTLAPAPRTSAAESTDQAQKVRDRIESLRLESVKVRHQVEVTVYELNRLQSENIELREQLTKYTAELLKMEEQAKIVRDQAEAMSQQGQVFFKVWEEQIAAIANPKIREQAQGRRDKRLKSYQKIADAMNEVRALARPFLSNLNDLKTLLGSELTRESVVSAEKLITEANFAASDVVEALKDVETALDRVAAELNKYK
jgi:chromosome segregation ATPase